MSRPLTAASPSAPAVVPEAGTSPTPGRHGAAHGRRGRHRVGAPTGVRCTDLPAVRARLDSMGRTPQRRGFMGGAFVQWLLAAPPSGRHTWSFLAQAGGRPRTAFAIILSL